MKHHTFLFSLFLLGFSLPLSAQEIPRDSTVRDSFSNYFLFDYISSLTANDYVVLLDSIKRGISNDYFTLRMAYTKSPTYNPYATETKILLKTAIQNINKKKYDEALSVLAKIQENNYVNILSHLYSGYTYLQKGDTATAQYHYGVHDGLLRSIFESGNGSSPQTAYIVIAIDEEYSFLDRFQLRPLSQTLVSEDGYSFDVIKAVNPDSTTEYTVYFNISLGLQAFDRTFKE